MVGFFPQFYEMATPTNNAGEFTIKLSVLKLCLRDNLETDTFELGLSIIHTFFSQLFNATDSLKATRATHWFLDLNKSFTELKSDDENLFRHVFEKIFCLQFYF